MASIKVHVLNFHGIFSHIEIVLENTTTQPPSYYGVNRWSIPENEWSNKGPDAIITEASSTFSFHIQADPQELVHRWRQYWLETESEAGITSNNCAVAAQWFLSEFAGIPKPNLSNVSFNLLILGILWPSFIPCPVVLPGRIMSNAKFHIEAREHPEIANAYSRLFLYASMALAVLVFSASVVALGVASTLLTGGFAALAITGGCIAVGLVSTHGFFKANNLLSAKNISDEQQSLARDEAAFVIA